jgi:uncharacterized protein YjbI with pentapeptide repeats
VVVVKVNGYTIKPGAGLEGANLSGANLAGANLEWADLTGACEDGHTVWPAEAPMFD